MNKTQQYVVQKYVMAESVEQAVRKSKKVPIHEVFISSAWFEKMNSEFFRQEVGRVPGFGTLSTPPPRQHK